MNKATWYVQVLEAYYEVMEYDVPKSLLDQGFDLDNNILSDGVIYKYAHSEK